MNEWLFRNMIYNLFYSTLYIYILPGICRIRVSVDTLKFQGICRYPK